MKHILLSILLLLPISVNAQGLDKKQLIALTAIMGICQSTYENAGDKVGEARLKPIIEKVAVMIDKDIVNESYPVYTAAMQKFSVGERIRYCDQFLVDLDGGV